LQVEDDVVCSVLPQWTDLVAPDPEIVIGNGKAVARVGDLLELARLVAGLREARTKEKPDVVSRK